MTTTCLSCVHCKPVSHTKRAATIYRCSRWPLSGHQVDASMRPCDWFRDRRVCRAAISEGRGWDTPPWLL